MARAALIRRLERLEAEKAHEEGTRFILNFAGRDAEVVRDDLGRRWDRRAGESYPEFEGRATADRPFGFVTMNVGPA